MTLFFIQFILIFQDTLTKVYSEKWDGVAQSGPVMRVLESNQLIYIVLGVTLIIWSVVLFSLRKLEQRLSKLEQN